MNPYNPLLTSIGIMLGCTLIAFTIVICVTKLVKRGGWFKISYVMIPPAVILFMAGMLVMSCGARAFLGESFLAGGKVFTITEWSNNSVTLKRDDGKTMELMIPKKAGALLVSKGIGGQITHDEIKQTVARN